MSRLVDPTICPDCRAPLDPRAECTGCGLRLTGPDASELWTLMNQADAVVLRMRAALQPGGASGLAARQAAAPGAPVLGGEPARGRLPSASVPLVLLGLGALCLVVAIVVFATVSWGSLGLGAKTLLLLGFTTLLAAAAREVSRRGLSWAAESLWLVTAGALLVDLLAAWAADFPGPREVELDWWLGLSGLVLASFGAGVSAWLRRTTVGRAVTMRVVTVLGLAIGAFGLAGGQPDRLALPFVALPVLAVAVVVLVRLDQRDVALGAGVVGGLAWLLLLLVAVEEAGDRDGWLAVLEDGAWWRFAVAAAYGVLVAAPGRVAQKVRVAGATGALVAVGVMLFVVPGDENVRWLSLCAVTVTLAALSAWPAARRTPWAVGALAPLGLAVLAVSFIGLAQVASVVEWVVEWRRVDGLDLRLADHAGGPSPWLLVVGVGGVLAAVVALARALPDRREDVRRAIEAEVRSSAPGLAATALAIGLLSTGPLAPVGAGGLTLAALVALAPALVRGRTTRAGWGGVLDASAAGLAALTVATMSASTQTAVALLLAAAAAAWLLRSASGVLGAGLASAVAVGLMAISVFSWGDAVDATLGATAIAVAATVGILAVVAGLAPVPAGGRPGAEIAALLAGLMVLPLGTTAESALVLSVLGAAGVLVFLLDQSRLDASWVASGLLAGGVLTRLSADRPLPEAWSLPLAAVLVAVGVWRLERDPNASSTSSLAPGLSLALLPSLLIALDEPLSVRAVLVGLGALVVLAVGVARHWSAALVLGAVTTGILAVRELTPYAEGLPRWVLLGLAGSALLFVGVTWEARRRNLATAARYLRELR